MRTYVITSGAIFGLLALAHVWRIAAENQALGRDPYFVSITIFAAVMSVWAFRVVMARAK